MRRFLDVTHEPDFEPIPGVPIEPESALVMPMMYKGTVSGVIVLSRFERRTFHATFAFDDRSEGMAAFAEKRKPGWKHR